MITATIIADSISELRNSRITTFELEYPRFIHAELLTHRQFSRNSASSRAIPIDKMIEQVLDNRAEPIHWGLNQSGMQAKDEQADLFKCGVAWENALFSAVKHAKELQALGLHKQIVNRVLEPFQMMKVLVTATSFDNFFHLRYHKDAQPEIKELARCMYEAMQNSTPEVLHAGEWHTPYVQHDRDDEGHIIYAVDGIPVTQLDAIKISCSCAAQVSYRKNDTSIKKAISIYDKLVNSKPVHASAFEHCATPISPAHSAGVTHIKVANSTFCSGNFESWIQYRQLIPNHDCKDYQHENL